MVDINDIIEKEPFGKFSFRLLRLEDVDAALEHAAQNLFASLEVLGYDSSMEEDWRVLFKAILESSLGVSFLVVETATGKVCQIQFQSTTLSNINKTYSFFVFADCRTTSYYH
jgi:hypothetical protein